ncbi:glucosamine-6-phosphate deaminase [Microbacterium sp. ZXX196]|uniref:glucosamine-6-phosphate deaminase n=1 Tax=Microbacterium sp. ZXX196 TaxID=2609291 RepID=UPI0012B8A12C|nr:glucosamine-6-phosphate deaminase [Microbacterium sp. ZXX196]MTE24520.1 glucosamine-6-phosphate deaminase [Microbacterium sp. ZXX196]
MAEIVIVPDAQAAGDLAADAIVALIERRGDAVLGLATGSTPLPVYRALAERAAGLDLARVRGFALDEYVGLDPAHPESYRSVIRREVIEPLGLTPELVRTPPADDPDLRTAGERYDAEIRAAGGVDVQLLGIGTDGHVGFNEPGSSFASRTRVKTLTRQTRSDNARFFDDPEEVPRHCLTQGLGTILEARHLVLLAFGEGKAEAVRGAVEGPVTAMLPASAIQLHPHVTVLVDEAAASRLELAEYYRDTYAGKPAWQGI